MFAACLADAATVFEEIVYDQITDHLGVSKVEEGA